MSGPPLSDDDDILAAELAFGLIDGGEGAAAERRLGEDAAFAAAFARWQAYAAAMADGRGEPPRPSLWREIEARLPANDTAPPRRASARGWKVATFAASAAALLFAVIGIERRPAPLPSPVAVAAAAPLVAMLTGTDSKAIVSVSFDPAQRRLTLTPQALEPGAHSAELWVIPADKRPRSLGVIDRAGTWREASASVVTSIAPGATLAVSMEPVGGSPTGKPTGPVVLSGTIHSI